MGDDRIEQLLRGYQLPEVPRDLDQRVLRDGTAILGRTPARGTVEEVGRVLLQRLGFGYLTWLIDSIAGTDAEYRVDLI
jgi:hypothetical protein